jgi:2-polyprenyl-3-methyl-5-hydroxy-6-metoxy-1,4-benzoquinol methylase
MRITDSQPPLAAAQYYDKRHARGWMDFWPKEKRERIIGLLRGAAPERTVRVLEYGCGVGVFANSLKAAMPNWEVHGCDISPVAISRARERCPGVTFHLLTGGSADPPLGTYDLIYTHHVLEHVASVSEALSQMARSLEPGGKMLHVTPCANPGSVEYRLSKLHRKGIDSSGCLFCDDSSHVRRLNSRELTEACREHGLALTESFFAGQFWGSIDYLTNEYHWTLLGWLNPAQGVTILARVKLFAAALVLGGLCLLRQGPRLTFGSLRKTPSTGKRLLWCAVAPIALVLSPLSFAVDKTFTQMKEREWNRKKRQPNGSEMYLVFEKIPAALEACFEGEAVLRAGSPHPVPIPTSIASGRPV